MEFGGGATGGRTPLKRLPVGFNHIRKRPCAQEAYVAQKPWLAPLMLQAPPARTPSQRPPDQSISLQCDGRSTSPPASPVGASKRTALVPAHICASSCLCDDRPDVCVWRPNGECVDQYLAQAHATNPIMPQDAVLEVYYAEHYDSKRANARVASMLGRHPARPRPEET
jgi:hypothetical protein